MRSKFNSSAIFLILSIASMSILGFEDYAIDAETKKICDSFRAHLEASTNRCGVLTFDNEFTNYEWSAVSKEEQDLLADNSVFFVDDKKKNERFKEAYKNNVKGLEVSHFDYNNDGEVDVVLRSVRPGNLGDCKQNNPHKEFTYHILKQDEKWGLSPVKLRYSTVLNPVHHSGKNYTYSIVSAGDKYLVNFHVVKKKNNIKKSQSDLFHAAYIPVCIFRI